MSIYKNGNCIAGVPSVEQELKENSVNAISNNAVKAIFNGVSEDLIEHMSDNENPHEVTKAQIGLGNVNNTSDADKPISTAQAAVNAGNQAQLDAFLTPKTIGPTALASFSDGVDGAILGKCVVNIKPVQAGSGTPSPTNVRPISGWTGANIGVAGKNLFHISLDSSTYSGITYTANQVDGTISFSGTITEDDFSYCDVGSIRCKAGVRYIISGGISREQYLVVAGTLIEDRGSGASVQFETDTDIVLQFVLLGKGVTYNGTIQPMIRLATDTDPTFEPYKGNQYDISFGEAGTVYGGTLDVGTGVLTVDKSIVQLNGTEDFVWLTYGDEEWMGFPVPNGDNKPWTNPIACSHFYNDGDIPNVDFLIRSNNNIALWFYPTPTSEFYRNTDAMKAYAKVQYDAGTPISYVYHLNTPTTYQLTPVQVRTLLDLNNIYADCGEVTVQYRGDMPNLYEIIAKPLWNEDADYPGCFYHLNNGVKEWLNPPMISGNTYRTTERYNGKPVYKLVTTVSNPPKAQYIQQIISGFEYLIINESFVAGLADGLTPHKVKALADLTNPDAYESFYYINMIGGGGGYNIWFNWSAEAAGHFTDGTPLTLVIAYTKTTD